jgi:prepilin-type processing-associated H-X9-DG protein
MGYVSFGFILLIVPILAGIALPVFSQVKLKAKETQSLTNARTIMVACRTYAVDHQGNFPKTLDELAPKYLPNQSAFVCPLSPTLPVGYDYFGGTDRDPPDQVVLMSKFADHSGKRIIVFVDGSAALRVPPNELPAGR